MEDPGRRGGRIPPWIIQDASVGATAVRSSQAAQAIRAPAASPTDAGLGGASIPGSTRHAEPDPMINGEIRLSRQHESSFDRGSLRRTLDRDAEPREQSRIGVWPGGLNTDRRKLSCHPVARRGRARAGRLAGLAVLPVAGSAAL